MIRKSWNMILNILIIFVAVSVLVVFAGYFCGFRYYVVLSGSMEPAIHTGSLGIVNSKAEYDNVETGDIVAFINSMGTRVTHRVVRVDNHGLITKGDANGINDGFVVKKEDFIGETVGSIPFVGYILMFLQSKKGIILSVAAIITLWLMDMIVQCLTAECDNKKHRKVRMYESKKIS